LDNHKLEWSEIRRWQPGRLRKVNRSSWKALAPIDQDLKAVWNKMIQ